MRDFSPSPVTITLSLGKVTSPGRVVLLPGRVTLSQSLPSKAWVESIGEAATPWEEVLVGLKDRAVEFRVRSVSKFSGGACSRSPCMLVSIRPIKKIPVLTIIVIVLCKCILTCCLFDGDWNLSKGLQIYCLQ